MTTTDIVSNGSKWAGESPDGIDVLEHRLRTETLDPRFERYGNFIRKERGGPWTLFGNFLTYSHVFNIRTDDAALVRRLRRLIRRNQATTAYQDAR